MSAEENVLGSTASRLLELAREDPRQAMINGLALLDRLDADDYRSAAITLRALSIAARLGGTIDESLEFGEQAIAAAHQAADDQLVAESMMTLAGSLAISGSNTRALEVLEEAKVYGESGLTQAAILSQEGAICHRLGQATRAMQCYERALPAFRYSGDRSSEALALNNMGMLRIDRGDLAGARLDLEAARALYLDLDQSYFVASADHNLGLIGGRLGDIPEALRLFDASESRLRKLVGSAAEVQVSRIEVLMSAGLAHEAFELAVEISSSMRELGLGEDEAEARLAGAQAAAFAGENDVSERWALEAFEMFTAQDRRVWAANARQVAMQARFQSGVNTRALAIEAKDVASILESERQLIPGLNARLLAGLIELRLGDIASATHELERVASHGSGPVEVRLQSWLARALSRQAQGKRVAADAAARAGMRLLDRYQAVLGATDIRNGVERHGAELGALGLSLALDSRNPSRVFAWMERSRARALRHPPVTPSNDTHQAADLAELRRVSAELRSAEGDEATQLTREAKSLQEAIRARARTQRGHGTHDEKRPDILGALGTRALVEFASIHDRLWAVVVKNGRHRLHDLGPETPVLAELESLRFTMRRLARRRGAATGDLARQIAARLDAMLFGPLKTGDGELVIVPTPALHGTSWGALPTCRGRAVTISPSAELWWRASRKRRRSSPVLVAAGPDLAHAEAEMNEVASLYQGPATLGPTKANVDDVRELFQPAAIAHIACHAAFEVENPMFSSLRLSDGDLTVYDMERMRRVPQLVILSACDSGFSDAHPGEELMGLSAALLSMGARSLIASVGLVPDSDATRALMLALHRNLRAKMTPAVALSQAQVAVDDGGDGFVAAASFVCIGAS